MTEGTSFPVGTPNLNTSKPAEKVDRMKSTATEMEESSFDATSIIKIGTQPHIPKGKKLAVVVLSRALDIKDATELSLGIGSILIEQSRAVHEISKVFFEPLQVLDKVFLPLRFFGWAHAPFVAINLASDTVDFFTTPGWRKVLPTMKSVVDIAVMAEMAANAALLLQSIGVVAAQNVHFWAMPLGSAAIGVQNLGLVINGWGLFEVTNSLNKLNKILKEASGSEDYTKAIDLLTKQETRAEKFRAKFFKTLSNEQEERIVRIHQKVKSGDLQEKDIKSALKAVKYRFHLKQFGYTLAMTAALTGMVGIAILMFAPSPIAPLGWALIGVSASVSLTLVGITIYAQKRLDKELKAIDSESLPGEKPPFHRRVIRHLHSKLKRKQDGTYVPVN
ncbi:hypothetical protein PHSC3_001075 [Chlamydiales bacterium STE3]|nr:hypothetical protein PHSC3_001075 [Chlamydiales bacterium STE3]